ncbi:hypothetical protein C7H19_13270 [Aphanothece hegewaldii CCALA 016]|uniref:Uncharacterized protein n=1 Tax=Aphanothece hegewaldii CCALA 016 TaxID=2107694 RepID=A0A2T1LWV5_9CHRO|nr:hypothetical protein [Aphanothece hegewaldii]PSF36643.1 hypothetical protein C7H19_13270 [Aphanothece hegewaldii CCALA 016]
MAADDRKKKILDHLNQSSGGIKYTSSTAKQNSGNSGITPSLPEPEKTFVAPPPPPKVENRKRRIMDHLNLSSNDFKSVTSEPEKKQKQQIQDHLKKSLG